MINQNACRENVARAEVGLSFREIADSPHGIGFRALGQQTAHDQIVVILAVDCIEEPHLSFADRAGKCNAWTNTVEREPFFSLKGWGEVACDEAIEIGRASSRERVESMVE